MSEKKDRYDAQDAASFVAAATDAVGMGELAPLDLDMDKLMTASKKLQVEQVNCISQISRKGECDVELPLGDNGDKLTVHLTPTDVKVGRMGYQPVSIDLPEEVSSKLGVTQVASKNPQP
jgi:hypothetical protein